MASWILLLPCPWLCKVAFLFINLYPQNWVTAKASLFSKIPSSLDPKRWFWWRWRDRCCSSEAWRDPRTRLPRYNTNSTITNGWVRVTQMWFWSQTFEDLSIPSNVFLMNLQPSVLNNRSWDSCAGEEMLLASLQVAGSSLELNCFSLIVCDCFLMVISLNYIIFYFLFSSSAASPDPSPLAHWGRVGKGTL